MPRRSGWFKVHYEAVDGWLFQLPDRQFKIAMTLLGMANWKPGSTMWNGEQINVARGSLITSIYKLAERTGQSRQVVRTCLNRLQTVDFLTWKSTHNHTAISITNYERYQGADDEPNPPANPDLTHDQPTPLPNRRREEGKKGRKKDLVDPASIDQVIHHLNTYAPKRFLLSAKTTRELVTTLLTRKPTPYTLEQITNVIDAKGAQWQHDEEKRQYLRPSTLFRPSNFAKYLAEDVDAPKVAFKKKPPGPPQPDLTGVKVFKPRER